MGRVDLSCAQRVAAIERAAQAVEGPLVIVAHSGGVIMLAHWAQCTQRPVLGALLATPPDFEQALPGGYPTLHELHAGGWLPVPRRAVAVSKHRRGQPQRPARPTSSASPNWPKPGAAASSIWAKSAT